LFGKKIPVALEATLREKKYELKKMYSELIDANYT